MEKKKKEWVQWDSHKLFTDLKKHYNSVKTDAMYILNEYGIPTKLVKLIRMYLNKIYSKVHTGKI
jgi:hypothetical protein